MRILQIAPPWFTVAPVGYGGIAQVEAGHNVTLLASAGSTSKAEILSIFTEPPSADLGSTAHELTPRRRAPVRLSAARASAVSSAPAAPARCPTPRPAARKPGQPAERC